MTVSPFTTIIEYEGKPGYLDICDRLLDYPSLLLGGRKVEYIDSSQFILNNEMPLFREKVEYNGVLDYLVALVLTVIFYPIILMAFLIKVCSSENDDTIKKLELFDKQKEAATKIQAVARGFLNRKLLNKQTEAAIKIQAVARGFLLRNKLKKEKEASESVIGKYIYRPIAKEINNLIQNPKPLVYKGLQFLFNLAAKESVKELVYVPLCTALGVSYADVKLATDLSKY